MAAISRWPPFEVTLMFGQRNGIWQRVVSKKKNNHCQRFFQHLLRYAITNFLLLLWQGIFQDGRQPISWLKLLWKIEVLCVNKDDNGVLKIKFPIYAHNLPPIILIEWHSELNILQEVIGGWPLIRPRKHSKKRKRIES